MDRAPKGNGRTKPTATRHVDHEDFARLARQVLSGGHAFRFVARGSSMHPAVRDGDELTFRPVTPQTTLRRGDVVLCQGPARELLAHRVVGFAGAGRARMIVVRGDATDRSSLIAPERVLGRAVRLSRHGRTIRLGHPVERWLACLRLALRGRRSLGAEGGPPGNRRLTTK